MFQRRGWLAGLLFAGACGAEGGRSEPTGTDGENETPGQMGGQTGSRAGAGGTRPQGGSGGSAPGGGGAGGNASGGNGGSASGGSGGNRPGSPDGGAGQSDTRMGGNGGNAGTPDGGNPSTNPPVGQPPAGSRPSDVVFDDKKLTSWHFTVAPGDWQKLQQDLLQTPPREAYVPATLKVDDQEVGKVGFRYKGAFGTLAACVSGGKVVCDKISYKVDFAEYDMDKRFHTLKKVNLHAQRVDPTHLHERLGYKLYREMGILTARSVHAKVYVNGAYHGLFGLTEAIDGRFTDHNFPKGQGNGNLYKEAWPLSSDASYYARLQKTNEDGPMKVAPTKIVNFHKALSSGGITDAAKVMDSWMGAKYFARYMAVDDALNNWDGVTGCYSWQNGCGNHNFYIYESQTENKLWLVPWDLDQTWGLFKEWNFVAPWNKPPANCSQRWVVAPGLPMASPGCDRLFQSLVAANTYGDAVKEMLDGPFDVKKLHADVDAWAAQIADAVKSDMNGPGFVRWQQAVLDFKRDILLIRNKMEAVRDGKPVVPALLRTGAPIGFEGISPAAFGMGFYTSSNSTSAASIELNTTAPLAGAADAKISFELRNSTDTPEDAFTQNAGVRWYLDAPTVNLGGLRQVKFRLKTDSARTIRIEIDSGSYKSTTAKVRPRFGWTVMGTAAGGAVTLDRAALGIQPWAQPGGDTEGSILGTARRLIIYAVPNGRGADGLMPAGAVDKGWMQLDDFQIVTN